jgi:hypothetical protein
VVQEAGGGPGPPSALVHRLGYPVLIRTSPVPFRGAESFPPFSPLHPVPTTLPSPTPLPLDLRLPGRTKRFRAFLLPTESLITNLFSARRPPPLAGPLSARLAECHGKIAGPARVGFRGVRRAKKQIVRRESAINKSLEGKEDKK